MVINKKSYFKLTFNNSTKSNPFNSIDEIFKKFLFPFIYTSLYAKKLRFSNNKQGNKNKFEKLI